MSTVEWTDAEREAVAKAVFDVRDNEYDLDEWDDLSSSERERWDCDARAALDALAPHVAAREAQAAAKASVLRGHLDVLRKVLFEDAATDHHMRLRKAHAVIQQAEQMEPFENAYASLRAERDELRATVARVEALADEDTHPVGPRAARAIRAALGGERA